MQLIKNSNLCYFVNNCLNLIHVGILRPIRLFGSKPKIHSWYMHIPQKVLCRVNNKSFFIYPSLKTKKCSICLDILNKIFHLWLSCLMSPPNQWYIFTLSLDPLEVTMTIWSYKMFVYTFKICLVACGATSLFLIKDPWKLWNILGGSSSPLVGLKQLVLFFLFFLLWLVEKVTTKITPRSNIFTSSLFSMYMSILLIAPVVASHFVTLLSMFLTPLLLA